MAETRTARFSMPQWGAGTDSGSRGDFNEAFANIELWAARDEQGLRSARPAANIRGRYYTATDTKVIYRDNGTSWDVVGAVVENSISVPTTTSAVPSTTRGLAGQTGDLQQNTDSASTVLSRFRADGSLHVNADVTSLFGNAAITGASVGVSPATASKNGMVIRGLASQTADLFRVQDSSSTDLFRIAADGQVIAPNVTVTDLNPSANGDLIPKQYADNTYFATSGGSISGDITLTGATRAIRQGTVAGVLNFVTSRAGVADTIPMSIAANGGVQVGGLTGAQAAVIPLLVKGAASQSANLQEWHNSAAAVMASLSAAGLFTAASITATGTLMGRLGRMTSAATGDVPMTVKGFTGQTGALQTWTDNSNAVLASILADGSFTVGGVSLWSASAGVTNTAVAQFVAQNAAHRALIARAAASQSVNIQEWQNSGSSVLSSIMDDGTLNVQGAVNIYGATRDATNTAQMQIIPRLAAHRALALRGAASQSANLLEFLNSTPTVLSAITATGQFRVPAGTVGAPGLHFMNSTTTGLISSATNQLDVVANGVTALSALADGTLDLIGIARMRKRLVFDAPPDAASATAHRTYYNVAGRYLDTSNNGALVFTAPAGVDGQTVQYEFVGYDQSGSTGGFSFRVSMFNNTGGAGTFDSASVEYFSDYKPMVRVGKDGSGKISIIIGDTGTAFAFSRVTLARMFVSGNTPTVSYAEGWTTAQVTSLAAYSSIITPTNRSIAGAGSVYDANVVHNSTIETITGAKTFQSSGVGSTPLIVKSVSGQTAAVFQYRNSSDFPLISFEASGSLNANNGAKIASLFDNNHRLTIQGASTITGDFIRAERGVEAFYRVRGDGTVFHSLYGTTAAPADSGDALHTIVGFSGQFNKPLFKVMSADLLSRLTINTSGSIFENGMMFVQSDFYAGATGANLSLRGGTTAQTVARLVKDAAASKLNVIEVGTRASSTDTINGFWRNDGTLVLGNADNTGFSPYYGVMKKSTTGDDYEMRSYLASGTSSAARSVLLQNSVQVAQVDLRNDGDFRVVGGGLVGDTDVKVGSKSLPRGEVAFSELTAISGGATTSNVTVDSVTFTAVAGRKYKITVSGNIRSTVDGDRAYIQILDGSTLLQSVQTSALDGTNSANGFSLTWRGTLTAGSRTINLAIRRLTGTGSVSIAASAGVTTVTIVEDIGA